MFFDIFKAGGAFTILQSLGLLISLLWCLIPAILLGMRWRVPPAVSALPLFLFPLIAYFTGRSVFRGRSVLDFLSWIPFAIPGVLLIAASIRY